MTDADAVDRLAETQEVEGEVMARFERQCPVCSRPGSNHEGNTLIFEVSPTMDLHGIATCRFHPESQIPVAFRGGYLDSTAPTLPVNESPRLEAPDGLRQDVREAEQCHFYGLNKASALMCRRALQLGYEYLLGYQGDSGKTLGPLLKQAKDEDAIELEYFPYSERVKGLGDDGAHQRSEIDGRDVANAIYLTVLVLNRIFEKKPATQ